MDTDEPSTTGPFGEAATYERRGHVATVTYNRPESLNAINGQMRRDLNAAWDRFAADEDAWVAVVTGAGDRAFCAGGDLVDGAGAVGEFPGTFWEKPTINSFESGQEIFKPIIAAVNGHCIGYGLTAVTFCDFVLASDRATFAYPEVLLGTPTIVGAIRLPRRIGWANAMELLLTGERVDAVRAKELGIVHRIVPHDQLREAADELAERLCRAGPLAARATKEVAWRTQDMSWIDAVRFGETMRKVASDTDDAREGRQAWAEGRAPRWTGH